MNNITTTTTTTATIDIHLDLNTYVKIGSEQWAYFRNDDDDERSRKQRFFPLLFRYHSLLHMVVDDGEISDFSVDC